MTDALPPGSVIGILGGGQLAGCWRWRPAGWDCAAMCSNRPPAAPPPMWPARVWSAGYDDAAALADFARSVDVVTYEFENIPPAALDVIEAIRPIRPGRAALVTSRDRLAEKRFLTGLGLTTAPFADVPDAAALDAALGRIGTPAILKTRTLGYDGKGQVRITDPSHAAGALAGLQGAPAILEGFLRFSREVSVIAARALDGAVAAYDPGENVHQDGILRTTTVPARLTPGQRTDAVLIAARILNALDYVGVLGVELFVTDGGLVVNEIAPRVHNSGHWTQAGCLIDQFEQHIRAVAGWPLGDGSRHADVEMENLIGDDVLRVPGIARTNAAIHLYGKAPPGRAARWGNVNRIVGR